MRLQIFRSSGACQPAGVVENFFCKSEKPTSPVILIERENLIRAGPYQRGGERNGYANGFKPRIFQTTVDVLQLAVPQVLDSHTPFGSR